MLAFLKGKSGVIEPFQLQTLCQHVEQQVAWMQAKGATAVEVGRKELGGQKAMDAVVRNFYQQAITKLPRRDRKRAQRLCEEGLLTADGYRLPLQEAQIEKDYKLGETVLN